MAIPANDTVDIIGGGLAGSEAAWQLARRGFRVRLFEMRPVKNTPAHQSDKFAELVCSNSFRGADLKNAVGLLKEEMRLLDSLILQAADQHRIPGGGALVMDREGFSESVTAAILAEPRIEIIREEVSSLTPWLTGSGGVKNNLVIATGPLTSDALALELAALTGEDALYFYDSIAPIVSAESIDMTRVFRASRYDKGTPDYLNCPLNREEYEALVTALQQADKMPTKDFEAPKYFEACLPIEVLAERGVRSLSFGPMKPVGLHDPKTGQRPYAVVQLRQDDLHGSLYNLVGFQTRMKYPDQLRIFRTIPGLEQAEFVRLGSMHRNTYINAPKILSPQLEFKNHPGIYLAGQMIGVEGYVESAAMGLYVGLALARRLQSQSLTPPPATTALGALVRHLTEASPRGFQPMNVNFGLFDLPFGMQRKDQRGRVAEMAIEQMKKFAEENSFSRNAVINPLPQRVSI